MRSATWSQRLSALLLLSIGVALPLAWVVGGYLEYGLTEIIGFRVADGWCTPGQEPLGQHCFSDFSVIPQLLDATSLWEPTSATATAYPPSGWLIPVGVYAAAGSVGGLQFATYVFLSIALISTLVPALWVGVGDWIGRAPVALLAIGVGAAPVLVVLDRGNSTALIIVPLMVFAIGLFRARPSWVIAGVVVSTMLKPQMILLVIALIALRRFRDAVVSIALSVLGILASFAVWPGNRIQNFSDWINNVLGYSDYGSLDVAYPYNLSATRSILIFSDLLGFSSMIGEENRGHLVNVLTRFSAVPGLLLLVAAVAILVIRHRRVDPLAATFVSVALVIVVPGTSFSYYLVLLVPIAALILKDPRLNSNAVTYEQWRGVLDDEACKKAPGSRVRSWALVTVIVISFSLWAIPLPESLVPGIVLGDSVGLVQILWGPVVLVGLVVILGSLVFPMKSKTTPEPRISPTEPSNEIPSSA